MLANRSIAFVTSAALCVAVAGVVLAEEDIDTRARIEGYVKLLGADDAKTREDAATALVALGEKVRPIVEKSLADASADVRSRARDILARLDDAARQRTGEDQTWPGLRGGPTRSGVASGELPKRRPRLVWSQECYEKTLLQGAVVPAGEYVACLSADGAVRAFSAKDGARLWLSEVAGEITASGVLAAERLVVPTSKGLVALDAKDGSVAWKFTAPYGSNAAPAIVGRRVYAAFRNFGVKAFDLVTGEEVFTRPLAPAGALLADADLVVCGTEDGALVRIDPSTGKEKWRKELGAPPNMGPTLAAPGVVVAFTRDRFLRAFRTDDGKELWRQRLAAVSGSESLGAAAGRLFLTDTAGWITALDAGTGRLLWHRNEGFIDMGGPCATSTAVIASSRGRMTCRDADSGDWLWRLDADSKDNAAPAAAGGRIYVLYDDELRCYE
jgi:outer membrane protein assembly factor BamB